VTATENTARLLEELGSYATGIRAIVADGLPRTEHCSTAVIILHDCSPELLHALESCGGTRIREHANALEYVDLRGARVSVRAVERPERAPVRRRAR
jgi:hypothetical protein